MKIKTIYGSKGFDSLFKSKTKKTPIRLLSLLDINNKDKSKKNIFNLKTSSKILLKNKLLISFNEKSQDTSNTIFKSNSNFNNNSNSDYTQTAYNNTINVTKFFNEKLNQINLNLFNKTSKNLAIVKNGIIYWLRKIYLIIQGKSINHFRNKLLYLYFYYPIKDINITRIKYLLYDSKHEKIKEKMFCNNLEEIYLLIKDFIKNKKIFDYSKIFLYNEDFNMISNSYQLMEKNEKFKILYAKIIRLPDKTINKTMKRCFQHEHNWKSFDSKTQNTINSSANIFNNKYIQNKIVINNKNYNNKIKKDIKHNLVEIAKTLNNIVLNDIDLIPSYNIYDFEKKRNKNLNSLLKHQKLNQVYLEFHRNNTMNNFIKIKHNEKYKTII